tara:strand:+ start:609 stop:848 length:240 start_codon:yes stop_codon:yes gene_type:complete
MYQARHLTKKRNVWRFKDGDLVYVYGWNQDQAAVVVTRVQSTLWPQYVVRERNGDTWTISQLLLSSKVIFKRNDAESDD